MLIFGLTHSWHRNHQNIRILRFFFNEICFSFSFLLDQKVGQITPEFLFYFLTAPQNVIHRIIKKKCKQKFR